MVADSAGRHSERSLSGRKTSEESFESKEGITLMKADPSAKCCLKAHGTQGEEERQREH